MWPPKGVERLVDPGGLSVGRPGGERRRYPEYNGTLKAVNLENIDESIRITRVEKYCSRCIYKSVRLNRYVLDTVPPTPNPLTDARRIPATARHDGRRSATVSSFASKYPPEVSTTTILAREQRVLPASWMYSSERSRNHRSERVTTARGS